jgi:uncharacterized protein YllA (UPF0747 family)
LEKELKEQFSHTAVTTTARRLEEHYKVQASGREINLFYLIDDKRERIEFEMENLKWKVYNCNGILPKCCGNWMNMQNALARM